LKRGEYQRIQFLPPLLDGSAGFAGKDGGSRESRCHGGCCWATRSPCQVWSSLHADSSMPSSHRSTKCISVITYRASNIWWVQSMTIMSLKYHDSEVFLQSEVGIPLWEKMEILAVFQFLNGCFMWQQEVKYVFSIQKCITFNNHHTYTHHIYIQKMDSESCSQLPYGPQLVISVARCTFTLSSIYRGRLKKWLMIYRCSTLCSFAILTTFNIYGNFTSFIK
jgi:hypothetical protein